MDTSDVEFTIALVKFSQSVINYYLEGSLENKQKQIEAAEKVFELYFNAKKAGPELDPLEMTKGC